MSEERKSQPSRSPSANASARPSGKRVSNRATGEDGQKTPPRRRKRRKRGMGIFGALLYVILVIGFSALLAGVGWLWACDLLALDKDYTLAVIDLPASVFSQETVEVDVYDDDGEVIGTEEETRSVADMDYVSNLLYEEGIIEYEFLFKLFASFTGTKYNLSVGIYELDTDMDYRALISNMGSSSTTRTTTQVTLTEGMTLAQIFEKLEEAGVSTVELLNETAANYDFKFSFLKDVIPLGEPTRLEGYLFPDTYSFYVGEDPVSAINKMIVRFDEMFTDEMREMATEMGYTIHEMVTIASMIEKETDGSDQTRISSVIFNRLEEPTSETVGYLNIDATIAYVTGRAVTVEDYSGVDSEYNTYLYTGLPPGPIANPGMVALRSAFYPADESYYYYALGDDGVHHYFYTLSELTNFLAS